MSPHQSTTIGESTVKMRYSACNTYAWVKVDGALIQTDVSDIEV